MSRLKILVKCGADSQPHGELLLEPSWPGPGEVAVAIDAICSLGPVLPTQLDTLLQQLFPGKEQIPGETAKSRMPRPRLNRFVVVFRQQDVLPSPEDQVVERSLPTVRDLNDAPIEVADHPSVIEDSQHRRPGCFP